MSYQIKSVRGHNIAGRDFTYDLQPVTLFTGDNTAGKTTVLNAVRLGGAGYLKRLGSSNPATFLLAGAQSNVMSVMLALQAKASQDIERIERTWTKDKKGSVAYKESVPAHLMFPPILNDFDEYLKLKNADQVKFVFEKVKITDEKGIEVSVNEGLKKLRDEFPAKFVDVALPKIIDAADLQFLNSAKFQMPVQETLAKLIATLEADRKLLKADTDTLRRQLTALRHEGPIPIDVSEEVHALALQQKTVYDQIIVLQNQDKTNVTRMEQRRSAERRLAELKLSIAKDYPAETVEICQKLVDNATNADRKYVSKTADLRRFANDLDKTLSQIDGQMSAFQNVMDAKHTELKSLAELTQCPHCHSKGKSWKDHLENSITSAITQADDSLGELRLKRKTVAKEFTNAKQALTDSEKEDSRIATLTQAGKWLAELKAAQNTADQLQLDIGKMGDDIVSTSGVEALKEQYQEMCGRREVLDSKHAQFTTYQNKKKEALETEEQALRSDAETNIYAAAIKAVLAVQQQQLTNTFGSLLSVANKFLDGILPHKLVYHEGELGWFGENGMVNHRTFSGLEERLAYAGLQIALAQDAPCRIVIVDELGTMHPEKKAQFIERMLQLINEDVIDQCLCVDVTTVGYEPFLQSQRIGHIEV